MGALTPGPEDAKKQENSAHDQGNPTHDLKTIPQAAIGQPGALAYGR
jgi:hypothetical protein